MNETTQDTRGLGIYNKGILTMRGASDADIHIVATREAMSLETGSKNYIYNGVYEGGLHGGMYITSGYSGETKLYGGTFKGILYKGTAYPETVGNRLSCNGAAYIRDYDALGNWSVDIENATFDCTESGNFGLAVAYRETGSYATTVNLRNCSFNGRSVDLRVDPFNVANLYDGTVLQHNTTKLDANVELSGGVLGIINDYR